MSDSFYSTEELKGIGLKSFGVNVKVSKNAKIYGPQNITLGNNVRVDDFCILSGRIMMGSHIHIGAGSYLFAGDKGIVLEDFTGLSSRCAIYATSEDFSGKYLTNPVISNEYRRSNDQMVVLKKHSVVGTCSTILPGGVLEEGVVLGANSLLKTKTKPFTIYFGSPAKKISTRSNELLELEKEFIDHWDRLK